MAWFSIKQLVPLYGVINHSMSTFNGEMSAFNGFSRNSFGCITVVIMY